MRGRHVTTGVTLLVLLGILVLAALYGVKALFAPLPATKQPDAAASCSRTDVRKGQTLRAAQVQVSVFNGGTRAGLADSTLRKLVKRGFREGETGNAPATAAIKVAQVWTSQRNDAAARLVAKQLGPAIKVKLKKTDLGPGVDVLVGNKFQGLAKVKGSLVVKKASSACLPAGTTG